MKGSRAGDDAGRNRRDYDRLATGLAGVAGETEASWRKLVGPVARLPTWKFVRFNWRVTPGGLVEQREVIAKAVEVVRAEHPYLA